MNFNTAFAVTPEALRAAWRKVRANGGGPGGDGVTIEDFDRDIDRQLALLATRLSSGSYRPGPLRRYCIPKPSGGYRELGIPPIADRIAQTAVMLALVPLLDTRMADESFAYRPGRSVEQALDRARGAIAGGLVWIVDADIERFFDNVSHRILLQELAIWLGDPRFLALVGLWLRAWSRGERGLPQGAPLSPLLANLYLHPLDQILAAARVEAVRYADDFVMLCRTREAAGRARRIASGALASRGLRLNDAKTGIVHAREGVLFLGQRLRMAIPEPGPITRLPPPPSTEAASSGIGQSGLLRRTMLRLRDRS